MKRFLGVLGMLCPLLMGAQELKPLGIGDAVPDLVLSNISNYKSPSARLSDFRGKGVILDFWATWCTSCLKNFPKLDTLRERFKGRLEVVLVNSRTTGDTREKIMAFFQRRRKKDGQPYTFPCLGEDTVLRPYFPYRSLPHYVWIDVAGRVAAITDGEAVTTENVAALVRGEALGLKVKKDIMDYDRALPLLDGGNGGDWSALLYRTVFTGELDGMAAGTRRGRNSLHRKETYINLNILSLYHIALGFPVNRLVLEVKDSSRYLYSGVTRDIPPPRFSYEITAPLAVTDEELRRLLLADLDRYMGLWGRMERRVMDCWLLVCTAHKDRLCSDGGKPSAKWYSEEDPYTRLYNQPISRLVQALNNQVLGTLPRPIVLDETGYQVPVDLELAAPTSDLGAMRRELQKYGLDLVPGRREVEVFVLREAASRKLQAASRENE